MHDILSFYCQALSSFSSNPSYHRNPLEFIAAENGRFAYVDDRKSYSEPLIRTLIERLENVDKASIVRNFVLERRPSKIRTIIELFPKHLQSHTWERFIESFGSIPQSQQQRVLQHVCDGMVRVLRSRDANRKNALLSALLGFSFKSKSDNFPDFMFPTVIRNGSFENGSLFELKDSKGSTISSFNSTIPTQWKSLSDINAVNGTIIVAKVAQFIDFPFSLQSGYDAFQRRCFYFVRTYQGSNKVRISLVEGSFFETLPKEKLIAETFKAIARDHLGGALSPELERTLEILNKQNLIAKSRADLRSIVNGVEKRASVSPRFRIMSEVTTDGNPHLYPEISERTFNLIVKVFPSRNRDQHYQNKRQNLIESFKDHLEEALQRGFSFDISNNTFIAGRLRVDMKELEHRRNGIHIVFQFHF